MDKGFRPGEKVDVVIRPEDVEIMHEDGESRIKGTVENVIFRGVHYEILININDTIWKAKSTVAPVEDSEVYITVAPENIHVMRKE